MKKLLTILIIITMALSSGFAAVSTTVGSGATYNFALEYTIADSAKASFTKNYEAIDPAPYVNDFTKELQLPTGGGPASGELTGVEGGFKATDFYVNWIFRSAKSEVEIKLSGLPMDDNDSSTKFMSYTVTAKRKGGTDGSEATKNGTFTHPASGVSTDAFIVLSSTPALSTNGYVNWGSFTVSLQTGLVPETAVSGDVFAGSLKLTISTN